MPNIYLRHPKYGAKVAIAADEAKADKLNGWEEFDPSAPKAPAEVAQEAPVVNALPLKRGRARKSPDSQGE
tara:strand:+ start:1040 stop:1252 length:213 start_codon:yes stop_codon:yes gene_type:complete